MQLFCNAPLLSRQMMVPNLQFATILMLLQSLQGFVFYYANICALTCTLTQSILRKVLIFILIKRVEKDKQYQY